MFKSTIINGKEFRFNDTALTKLFYKKIFHTELEEDTGVLDMGVMIRINNKIIAATDNNPVLEGETPAEYQSRLSTIALQDCEPEEVRKLLNIKETAKKLGFILMKQTGDYYDYWKNTNYDTFTEWLATNETSDLESPEFISTVFGLVWKSNKTTSKSKNL